MRKAENTRADLEAAERRVFEAQAKLDRVKREFPALMQAVVRATDNLNYEQAQKDLIPSLVVVDEDVRRAVRGFEQHVKNRPDDDIATWAAAWSSWREEIKNIVEFYHQHSIEEQTLAYRSGVANAAQALLIALNAPIDPKAHSMALSDIRRHLGVAWIEDQKPILSQVAQLAMATRNSCEEYRDEIGAARRTPGPRGGDDAENGR
jgi:hypothetical protein